MQKNLMIWKLMQIFRLKIYQKGYLVTSNSIMNKNGEIKIFRNILGVDEHDQLLSLETSLR